jgi:quinol monooxygenase YgiN
MIIIAGQIDLEDPARRDEVVAGSARFQLATRQDEPGCLAYCFAADPVVEGRIQVYELWSDEESLAAHFTHPNYLDMRDYLRTAGLKSADNRKYRCDLVKPVYDHERVPRADFDHD